MRCIWSLGLALAVMAGAVAAASASMAAAAVAPQAWVQMTETGAEVRAISADAGCPTARVDGEPLPLRLRSAADERFPTVCAAPLPAGARRISVAGETLQAPHPVVRRMVVFGDSGCRIKGRAVQACNDPAQWPFAEVARHAAARRPDLVVHLGDYYYRESACPAADARCAGSPSGDRWPAWSADFFDPARPLLAAAPWVFVRGNHESCARGGLGWFRLLDAASTVKACPAEAAPWRVPVGGLELSVLDSADAEDETAPPERVQAFARDLDAMQPALGRQPGWLLVHRPVWGLTPVVRLGPGAINVPLNATEQAAVKGRDLGGVEMVLSGHIHHFSSFDFFGRRPAQLVVGTGGDVGQPADSPKITQDQVWLDGLAAVHTEFDRFGYMVLDRAGEDGATWRGVFYDAQDRPVMNCLLQGRRLTCSPAAS
jgi:hypothetical protein